MPPADYISQAGSKASSFQPIHENIRNGRANIVAILTGHNILLYEDGQQNVVHTSESLTNNITVFCGHPISKIVANLS